MQAALFRQWPLPLLVLFASKAVRADDMPPFPVIKVVLGWLSAPVGFVRVSLSHSHSQTLTLTCAGDDHLHV